MENVFGLALTNYYDSSVFFLDPEYIPGNSSTDVIVSKWRRGMNPYPLLIIGFRWFEVTYSDQ